MAVAALCMRAEAEGVVLDADAIDDGIWIGGIERIAGDPGSGSRILCEVVRIAEEHQVSIRAAVVRDHGRLLEYYREHGFDEIEADVDASGRPARVTVQYQP